MHEIEEIDINDLQTKEFFALFPQKQQNVGTLKAFVFSLIFFFALVYRKRMPV